MTRSNDVMIIAQSLGHKSPCALIQFLISDRDVRKRNATHWRGVVLSPDVALHMRYAVPAGRQRQLAAYMYLKVEIKIWLYLSLTRETCFLFFSKSESQY